jgi:WD40 repeat protein
MPQPRPLAGNLQEVRCLAWSPDGSCLATGGQDGTVKLWDAGGERKGELLSPILPVSCLGFTADGKMLAVAREYTAVELWNVDEKTMKAKDTGDGLVRCMAFTADGRLLATAGKGPPRVRDGKTGAVLRLLPGYDPGPDVFALAFSPDGEVLATGDQDGAVRMWDVTRPTRERKP